MWICCLMSIAVSMKVIYSSLYFREKLEPAEPFQARGIADHHQEVSDRNGGGGLGNHRDRFIGALERDNAYAGVFIFDPGDGFAAEGITLLDPDFLEVDLGFATGNREL